MWLDGRISRSTRAALGSEAAWPRSRLIAANLIDLGVTVDCLPLADAPVAATVHQPSDQVYHVMPPAIGRLSAP